jgi:hypothetical protein
MHPVTKTNFGVRGIRVNYYNTSTSALGNGYIIQQTGTFKFIVSDGVTAHPPQLCILAQTPAQVAALGAGSPALCTIPISASVNNSGSAASGTVRIVTNLQANDTLALGGTTITFVASGATGSQVNIGANANATTTALGAFLSGSTDTNLVKSSYTVAANVVSIVYKTVGTAGNTFAMAPTSGGRIVVSASTLAGGIAVSVEHVRVLYATTTDTVEGNRYVWSKGASVNGSAVISTYS